MKSTVLIVMSVLGLVVFAAPASLAHNHSNDRALHQQRRLADHQRHDAGISWQQDRQIHRQDRQLNRFQHNYSNFNRGYNNGQGSYYYGNSGSAGHRQMQYGAPYQQYSYTNPNVYQYPYSSGSSFINGLNNSGHSYSADGHRFDHHGNHDDGRFDH
jgi:hypothetical protein